MSRLLAVLPVSLFLVACGGFEGTATQKIELKGGDVENGTISTEKELDGDSSNWDTFLKAAKDDLGGEPTELNVDSVKITFDATNAKSVGKFEDVVSGDLIVSFRIKDTNEIIDIAKVSNPKGTGTVELDVTNSDVSSNRAKLKQGAFKIGLRAPTSKLKTDDFTLPVIVTFGLTANN